MLLYIGIAVIGAWVPGGNPAAAAPDRPMPRRGELTAAELRRLAAETLRRGGLGAFSLSQCESEPIEVDPAPKAAAPATMPRSVDAGGGNRAGMAETTTAAAAAASVRPEASSGLGTSVNDVPPPEAHAQQEPAAAASSQPQPGAAAPLLPPKKDYMDMLMSMLE